jgi:hypothetical protein
LPIRRGRREAGIQEELGAFRAKYDQLGQAIEGRAVKALANPGVSIRDLKAIAGTLAQTQKIRDKALGGAAGQAADKLAGTVAGYYRDAREASAKAERRKVIGRALGNGPIDDDSLGRPA